MRLKEQNSLPTAALPITQFKEYLRLGSGFGEDSLQDTVIEATLRAALAAIETRTGKALLERTFVWQVDGWRQPDAQALPVAPANAISWLKTVTRDGTETIADLTCFYLESSDQRPTLRAACSRLPVVPTYGYAELGFTAGYAADWDDLPADLAQAVLLLASYFYEARNEIAANDGNMPLPVTQLIERYRTVRILGGSAA